MYIKKQSGIEKIFIFFSKTQIKNKCSLKIWKSFQNNVKSKNLYSKLDVHIEKSISDGMVKPFLGEKLTTSVLTPSKTQFLLNCCVIQAGPPFALTDPYYLYTALLSGLQENRCSGRSRHAHIITLSKPRI